MLQKISVSKNHLYKSHICDSNHVSVSKAGSKCMTLSTLQLSVKYTHPFLDLSRMNFCLLNI